MTNPILSDTLFTVQYKIYQKKQRNQQILWCSQQNPHLTLAEIAEFFDISRQRVWQILKKYKILEEKNESRTNYLQIQGKSSTNCHG